jgi:TnpA family transposase
MSKSTLLSSQEVTEIYSQPVLDSIEIKENCTLNKAELYELRKFKDASSAIYFAICLVYFKIKKTFVNFNYQNTTAERRHIMQRFFPGKPYPRTLVNNNRSTTYIENKVLNLCGYSRYQGKHTVDITNKLVKLAPHSPRQRQLCKALLDLFIKNNIAIPAYSTVTNIVSAVYNKENNRIIKSYTRHTNLKQRTSIKSLLGKTDNVYKIVSIRRDMKGFNTTELNNEIDKHARLKPIFDVAMQIMPKLNLPTSTINYYSSLVNFYTGPRLKQINPKLVQIYLLCYCYSKYRVLNDNLLEALKKRYNDYHKRTEDYSKKQLLLQIDQLKDTRKKVGALLLAINNHDKSKNNIPKKLVYNHIPKDELLSAAQLLLNDKLDKKLLYWQYVDSIENEVKLNLRNLFLAIDFIVTNNKLLNNVITYVKNALISNKFNNDVLPSYFKTFIKKQYHPYLINDGQVINNRVEFYLYQQIVYHISTNKISLKHSIKHKLVEEDLIPQPKWDKNKKKILKSINYNRLQTPIKSILGIKKDELTALYEKINKEAEDNDSLKIYTNKNGDTSWRLKSLEPDYTVNNSLFLNIQQMNIVDIMKFTDHKVNFLSLFESILPKSRKNKRVKDYLSAALLANAIRMAIKRMAYNSDLNESSLLTTDAAYIRIESISAAINRINNAATEFSIYREWYINNIMHGSQDALKLGVSIKNKKARYSKKYFGQGVGVSSFNEITNYYSISSSIIGANEYEGSFAFEMAHNQDRSPINVDRLSNDKHGTNSLNYGLFDLTDKEFAPRIPKLHNETLWGFGSANDYSDYLIKPKKFINEELIISEWDNIQRFVASLLTGPSSSSVTISKVSSNNYTSRTKKAFNQYNHIVRSIHILKCIDNPQYRHAIMKALNRGESYNSLYRAITILNKGEIRGYSEIEMEIWNQCTRLIASIILYYNTYILNQLYLKADKDEKGYLVGISPSAWTHINLLGSYQFSNKLDMNYVDYIIDNWQWKNSTDFVENFERKR